MGQVETNVLGEQFENLLFRTVSPSSNWLGKITYSEYFGLLTTKYWKNEGKGNFYAQNFDYLFVTVYLKRHKIWDLIVPSRLTSFDCAINSWGFVNLSNVRGLWLNWLESVKIIM